MQGFAWLPEGDFTAHFAADVAAVKARAMCAVQQPLSASALQEVMGVPAWKSLPSWYMVAADDEAIPPQAERQFAARMGATAVEVPSSHVAMVSHPGDVLALIQAAAHLVPASRRVRFRRRGIPGQAGLAQLRPWGDHGPQQDPAPVC
jgi:hypothetical protein